MKFIKKYNSFLNENNFVITNFINELIVKYNMSPNVMM